jgi:hypothetical protein
MPVGLTYRNNAKHGTVVGGVWSFIAKLIFAVFFFSKLTLLFTKPEYDIFLEYTNLNV